MKKCTKCGELSDNFSQDKRRKDKLYSWCKSCETKKVKVYQQTKDGLITKIYSHQRQSSKSRGHELPTYTLKELRDWCFNQKVFHELYDSWKESDFPKELRPSCDRMDDTSGYSLDRFRLTTWEDNHSKATNDMKIGVLISGIPHKSVEQRTFDGVLIESYISTQEASRVSGVYQSGISRACSGKRNSAGGFIWNFMS
jgi:hypothetical protein